MLYKSRSILICLFLCILAVAGTSFDMMAQADESGWTNPVNLSHSGAASKPAIVVVPDGTLRILWWDEFDGLMVVDGTVSALGAPGVASGESETGENWSAPSLAPILLPTEVTRGGQEQIIPLPIEVMPHIVGDTDGEAHAFWLGEPDEETEDQPLLYSRLAPGNTSWSSPRSLADAALSLDATTDVSGTVHVAYVQTEGSQARLYYRRARNAGAWSTATAIQQSRYLRLLPSPEDSISLTADDSEHVYATWDDPRRGQMLMAHTADGGATWHEPRPLVPSDGNPLQNQVITLPGQGAPILWELANQDQSLLAVSSADDALLLAVWDGVRWSETRRMALHLQDPELGEPLRLSDLQLALSAASSEQEQAEQTLIVVGVDQNQDLWITSIQTEALERLFDQPEETSPLQSGDGQEGAGPPVPVNLSRSGVASSPAIVAGTDSSLRAFWWDQFDGLMVADGTLLASTVLSGTEEIVTTRESWSGPRPVPLPATTTPWILADATDRVHAFWIQEPTKEEQAVAEVKAWPLMYSRLASNATAWLPAVTLAASAATFDVASDASGTLHLAYIQAVDTPYSRAGVYYRRMEEEETTWLAPIALDQSRYVRLLSEETAHVRLAAEDAGGVYVTWDDPRLEELALVHSPDGGRTWEIPRPLGDSEAQPRRGQFVAVPGGEILLLWEEPGSGGACSLYQAPVAVLLTGDAGSGDRVLEELTVCPEDARYVPLGAGQILMVAGGGSDSLTLAAWDGEQWSEPSRLSYSFEDLEMGRQVYLSNLQAAMVGLPASPTGGPDDKALLAVGTDQEGDVWVTPSQMGGLDMVFAPPPPWSAPASFAQSGGSAGLPAITTDAEGRLHALWSAAPASDEPGDALNYARRDEVNVAGGIETRWTNPTKVLAVQDGGAEQPALIAVGDQLHAVWRGGQEGQSYYSQAFASDAYVASGWQEPQSLPAPAGVTSWPDIAADAGGGSHVVYAVPVNEGRGIYYTRSDDGQSWSEAHQVFDAAAAGWAMSDYPRLAVDLAGTIHVVWVRADPLGSGLTQAIYYAQSVDGGETWSEALEVAGGAYSWPQVITSGADQVHLLWNETTGGNAWWHQWSADGGLAWTRAERVPGFGNQQGPIGAMADGSGTVHLVGLGHDDSGEPTLLYMTWDGERWGERKASRLDLTMDELVPGVSTALLPALGRLDAVFRGEGQETDEGIQTHLWHTGRTVPAVVATPVPTFTPRPTPTLLPTPAPTTFATPTPNFSTAPPQSSGGSMDDLLPWLLPGGLAALTVAGAFVVGVIRTRRR